MDSSSSNKRGAGNTAILWRIAVILVCFRFVAAGVAVTQPSAGSGCPRVCFCNALSQIVYCSRRGLTTLPESIPPGTLQLNLNGNAFQSGIVGRTNMSQYTGLQHLYMSECGLEQLHVDTFVDLVELRWLDLSNNRLKVINDFTFRGLTLDHLFLNGNRQIQLQAGSFEGLVTAGLYLHDCSIKSVRLDVLASLNVTLRNLWLNGNELERIDRSLLAVFTSLQHLRLGSNPLHCGCEAVWLMEFYERNADVFRGASEPSCAGPLRLRGQHFNQLSLTDFRCQAPVFNNIDIMLSDTVGRLKCSATGDPAPTLFWIQPNGRTTKYAPSQLHHQQPSSAMLVASPTSSGGATLSDNSDGSRRTDGVLLLKPDGRQPASASMSAASPSVLPASGGGASGTVVAGVSGMYICIANNEAGNVTLAVNVSWPQFNRPPTQQQPSLDASGWTQGHPVAATPTSKFARRRPPDNGLADASNQTRGGSDLGLEDEQIEGLNESEAPTSGVVGGRLFSVSEMICAVVITHVITLIISLVIVAIFVRRRVGKLRRQQQLLPPPLHVATGPPSLGGSSGGGGMCLGGAGAGGYRLPPSATGSLCRPIPSYATDYAVYDNTQSRTTMGGAGTGAGTGIIPFSYHLRPAMT